MLPPTLFAIHTVLVYGPALGQAKARVEFPYTDWPLFSPDSALDIPPQDKNELAEFTAILDPDDEGFANFPSFVAICALKLHARDQGSNVHTREVDDAFGLFTGTDAAGEPQSSVITVAHLRRVATVLKEEVDDDLLRDMILEANGGAGVGRGVKKGEFENVMRRAGVWR